MRTTPAWLGSLLRASALAAIPAFLLVPPVAAVLAAVEIGRQQWWSQGLWYLALSHGVWFVVRSALLAQILMMGVFATAHATAPRGVSIPARIAAAACSYALLLYPLQQLLLPTFRRLLFENEHGHPAFQALLAVPQTLVGAAAVWALLGWALLRWRAGRPQRAGGYSIVQPVRWAIIPGIVLAAAAVAVQVAAPQPPPGAPNVILVVVDTLRADHLGMYGYTARNVSPHLDALARESVVYENAMSTASWTTPAVAAILTGRYPRRLGYRETPAYLEPRELSIAEKFRSLGFRTHAVVSNVIASRAVGFDAGFESMDESAVGGHMNVSSETVTDHAIEWMEAHRSRPFLLYVHYFDPHFAYRMHRQADFAAGYHGQLREELIHSEFSLRLPGMSREDVDYVVASYDSEIAYTDAHIGRLLDRLRELGIHDRTMIVFTADHGEELAERGDHFIGHGRTVYQEQLHVPLIVKRPKGGGAGTRVAALVSTLDIAPTLFAAIGAKAPPSQPMDGTPLDDPDADRTFYGETRRDVDKRAVFHRQWKLIVDRLDDTSALFDLAADPGELRNVSADHPQVEARLKTALDEWETSAGDRAGSSVRFSEHEQERLKALGYAQ